MGINSFADSAKSVFKNRPAAAPLFDFLELLRVSLLQGLPLTESNKEQLLNLLTEYSDDCDKKRLEDLVLIRIYYKNFLGSKYRCLGFEQEEYINQTLTLITDFTQSAITQRIHMGGYDKESN